MADGPRIDRNVERTLGTLLRFYRVRAGFSQMALANSVGLTFQQIQKYENGSTRLSLSRFLEFAGILNFSTDEYFSRLSEQRELPSAGDDPVKRLSEDPGLMQLLRDLGSLENSEAKKAIFELVKAIRESETAVQKAASSGVSASA